MGDSRRFDLMAQLVAKQFPAYRKQAIADVAGGKGQLKAALYRIGFQHVTVIDKRHRLAKHRPGQQYAYFHFSRPSDYALVLGMHPDEATDHIVLYAVRNGIPFAICPCCVKPSAVSYSYDGHVTWIGHLKSLANRTHQILELTLPMLGSNLVLVGRPK